MSTTKQPRLIAGAMSGTSGDGIDVAIVRITGSGLEMKAVLVQHHHLPYAPSIRELLFAVRDGGRVKLADLAHLGWKISLAHARAVNETLLSRAIGPSARITIRELANGVSDPAPYGLAAVGHRQPMSTS